MSKDLVQQVLDLLEEAGRQDLLVLAARPHARLVRRTAAGMSTAVAACLLLRSDADREVEVSPRGCSRTRRAASLGGSRQKITLLAVGDRVLRSGSLHAAKGDRREENAPHFVSGSVECYKRRGRASFNAQAEAVKGRGLVGRGDLRGRRVGQFLGKGLGNNTKRMRTGENKEEGDGDSLAQFDLFTPQLEGVSSCVRQGEVKEMEPQGAVMWDEEVQTVRTIDVGRDIVQREKGEVYGQHSFEREEGPESALVAALLEWSEDEDEWHCRPPRKYILEVVGLRRLLGNQQRKELHGQGCQAVVGCTRMRQVREESCQR
ncbi:hypothetical protein NDU88_001771 [Pleurodeles waltl]|uniref:Uncharacterized protein n=1 Tax=Pleurodeles waltl TaxID=8319 RepID=A0AAV7P4Y7_PLEWA|nr:hypothetical protein NDU88_001771 [Pleurodeles waltl]